METRFDEVELLVNPGVGGDESLQPPARGLETAQAAAPAARRPEPMPRGVTQPVVVALPVSAVAAAPAGNRRASRWRRTFVFLTDFSLFIALGLALSPLLPGGATLADPLNQAGLYLLAMFAFILLVSYYYFVGSWLLWGKTVGGSIFDSRVVSGDGSPLDVRSASLRWCGTMLSLLTAGGGFVIGILPGGKTLADRMSGTTTFVA